jgi:uncharacterized membrane protein
MTGLNMTGFKINKIENQKLIFASLLLNLFLICSIAGGAYKLFANHQTGKAGQNALRFAAENLSQEQQQIAEPSFDRQAVEVALTKTREADRAVRMKIEVTMLNFAETLSAEDRQKLAEGLAKKGPLRQPPLMLLKDD